jgi:iron complex outermembrane recepter protein
MSKYETEVLLAKITAAATVQILFYQCLCSSAFAEEQRRESTEAIQLLSQNKAVDLVAQGVTRVTAIELKQTNKGLEVILKTVAGSQKLVPLILPENNKLVIDILDATLAFSIRNGVTETNPAPGISEVKLTKINDNNIRLTVTGENQTPNAEVVPGSNLVLSITPEGETTVNAPDQEIEIIATGEAAENGYNTPDAATATKTDTPLRDVPQAIQVIPRKLLEDRKVTKIEQVADNVPGVQPTVTYGGIPSANFFIRGFNSDFTVYRDGFREFSFANPININGVERIEFLKGPASVLYGQNEPGGLVNIVNKQPLPQPYYSPSLTIGSDDFYQGSLDLSGSLNSRETAAYRFNLAYENAGSFRDFVDSENVFLAPAFSFQLGPKTELTFQFEYQNLNFKFDRGFPNEPEIFDAPISRFLGEPDLDNSNLNYGRGSYVLEHEFNDQWKFRSGFAFAIADSEIFAIFPDGLQEDRRTVDRSISRSDESQQNFTLQNEVIGKFKTGSIEHQILAGVELLRYRFKYQFFNSAIASLDLFNPVYGAQPEGEFIDEFGPSKYGTDAISLYFQDQVAFSKQWKLLGGGRLDLAHSTNRDGFDEILTTDNTDLAFSPRIGLVYQPIDWLSLYGSYATSFNPVIFGTSRTGESFEPGTGRQFEAGIKADVIPNQLSATFAAYEITKKNVLISDPEDENFSIQTGEQKSRGIELTLIGRPVNGWDVSLAYALTDAFISEDTTIPEEDKLIGVPEHQLGLLNSYEIQAGSLKGLGGSIGLYYVGERESVLPNANVDLPSYFRTDASIFYKRDDWKFQLNVNNLSNVDIYNARGNGLILPQPPLTVLGEISVKF